MRYTKEEADRLLTKVEQHIAQSPDFGPEAVAEIHQMLQAWRGWVSLGRGAKWVITALGLVAAAIASWGVLTGALKNWLNS